MQKFDPAVHHRRSIRLPDYDYSPPGAYFITICTNNNACLFGEIVSGEMRLNSAGEMVTKAWNEIPDFYPGVDVDAFVVMPNHIHGIIVLSGDTGGSEPSATPGRARGPAPTGEGTPPQPLAPAAATSRHSLPNIVERFKSLTTKLYIEGVKEANWLRFNQRLWHRNYYEHVVRGYKDLEAVREYIRLNPANWHRDEHNLGARRI
ncbi:MAG: transposase [SAR202 cluster bacterium]|nr:transposase [SAR202 cluster bacterium]